MDGTRAAALAPHVHELPQIPARRHALPAAWAAVLGLGWPAVLVVALAIEPAADDPAAAPAGALATIVGTAVALAYLVALGRAAWLAARRDPAAARWALGAGAVTAAMVVSCPASGHHQVAGWWYAQLAITAAMLVVSAVGWMRVARPAARRPLAR